MTQPVSGKEMDYKKWKILGFGLDSFAVNSVTVREMSSSHRIQVLSLYKQILRMSKFWKAKSGLPEDTTIERHYIKHECQRLFRRNKSEISIEKIKDYIKEAETRIGLAEHYGIPYPRLMNVPHNVLSPNKASQFKKEQRVFQQATPIYLKSYESNIKPT